MIENENKEDSNSKIKCIESIPVNPMPDGVCRTIKAQYTQTSAANFLYTGSYGATGVITIYEIGE